MTGALIPNVNLPVQGAVSGSTSWVGGGANPLLVVQPPPHVPQTNTPAKDEAREKAVAKAGKIKKTKSSARW
jgi:hypothetical protein